MVEHCRRWETSLFLSLSLSLSMYGAWTLLMLWCTVKGQRSLGTRAPRTRRCHVMAFTICNHTIRECGLSEACCVHVQLSLQADRPGPLRPSIMDMIINQVPSYDHGWKIFVQQHSRQFKTEYFWVRVKISNSQLLEWLTSPIWKLTNVEMLNGRTYESLH